MKKTYLPVITILCEERSKISDTEYDITNNTDKTMGWILAQKHILTVNNKWRERLIYVYEDPDNKEMTYSVGYFNKTNDVCIAHEKLSGWQYEMDCKDSNNFVTTQ